MLRWLGLVDYEPTWRAMQAQVDTRGPGSPDEIWFLEHPPVFTLGMNAKPEHLLAPGDIPVVQIDRGGQVTYHGPGQLVVYPLIDLERARLGVRALVEGIERRAVADGDDGCAGQPLQLVQHIQRHIIRRKQIVESIVR